MYLEQHKTELPQTYDQSRKTEGKYDVTACVLFCIIESELINLIYAFICKKCYIDNNNLNSIKEEIRVKMSRNIPPVKYKYHPKMQEIV